MVLKPVNAIGGFFRWPITRDSQTEYLHSFRASLAHIILHFKIEHIFLPTYYCHEVSYFIKDTGTKITYYNINSDFEPILKSIPADSKVLYPNYFGICENAVLKVIEKFGKNNVILDLAQCFWMDVNCFAKLNSLRKFFAVPDGSKVQTQYRNEFKKNNPSVNSPSVEHLLAQDSSTAYLNFQLHEKSFEGYELKLISKYTEVAMQNINVAQIMMKRRNNFKALHQHLKHLNRLNTKNIPNNPLCFPFLPINEIKKKLVLDLGIYVPSYWPIHSSLEYTNFEKDLSTKCLFLPIDQRYDVEDMDDMVDRLKQLKGFDNAH